MVSVEDVVAAYVKTRDAIAALGEQEKALKAVQSAREQWLLKELHGVDSIKVHSGTVFKKLTERVTTEDSEAFFEWVREGEHWDCMDKRPSKKAVLEFMGEKTAAGRPNAPPPGLAYSSIIEVGIRRAGEK